MQEPGRRGGKANDNAHGSPNVVAAGQRRNGDVASPLRACRNGLTKGRFSGVLPARGTREAAMIVDMRLCGCGSGLRLVCCCQMDFSVVPPATASGPLLPMAQRAAEVHAQGAVEEAERLCLEVLELAPGQLEGLSLL